MERKKIVKMNVKKKHISIRMHGFARRLSQTEAKYSANKCWTFDKRTTSRQRRPGRESYSLFFSYFNT